MTRCLRFDANVPVLIFKTGYYPVHHGSIGAVRSLGRAGIPTYAVCESRWAPVALSKYIVGRFIWVEDATQALLNGMLAVGKSLKRKAMVLPTDDYAAVFLAENAGVLNEGFIFPQPPPEIPRAVADKKKLYFLCRKLCHPTPNATFPKSREDLCYYEDPKVYPVVVKRVHQWSSLNGSVKGTTLVRTREQLEQLLSASWSANVDVLVQEYIPECCSEDWFFHGYCNAKSECLASFTGRKLRSYPPRAGVTTFARSVRNSRLQEQAEKLLQDLSYWGIVDLDYRLDLRDGLFKLVDFNPRLGAQFRLFQDEDGRDVVRAQHLDLTGRWEGIQGEMVERSFAVELHDTLAAVSYIRSGDLTFNQWLREIRHVDEYAWIAREDPLPSAMALVWLFGSLAGRAFGIERWQCSFDAPVYIPGRAARVVHS